MTYVCFMNIVYNLLKTPINHLKTHITLLSATFLLSYCMILFCFCEEKRKDNKSPCFFQMYMVLYAIEGNKPRTLVADRQQIQKGSK